MRAPVVPASAVGWVAVAALSLLAAPGLAAADSGVEIISQAFDQAGDPLLVANLIPSGAPVSWSVCPPNGSGSCVPAGILASQFDPGPEPPGTIFVATAVDQGRTYTATSSAWLGTVAATAAPRLVGTPRVGASVTSVAGAWTGGFGQAGDLVGIEACKTQQSTGCVTITQNCGCYPGSGPAAVIAPALAGDYLFATDEEVPPIPSTGPYYGCAPSGDRGCSPAGVIPPVQRGPTLALSAPMGPIVNASMPPVPDGVVLRGAVMRRNTVLVARVTCPTGCRVSLLVRSRPAQRTTLTVHGSRMIGIARRGLNRSRFLLVTLRIGRRHPIVGTTRLP